MPKLEKPEYIRKYDFIRYFTRNKDEWFWREVELEQYVRDKISALANIDIDEDDEWEQFEEHNFDSLSLTKDFKESNEDMDQTDPKIYEGNLIDKASRQHIATIYNKCKIIDFDDYSLPNKQAFAKTLEIIKSQDDILLFQPTFIYKGIAIAKPDALVKQNGEYTLIETKGTSTTKLSHLIDIQYQVNVVDDVLKQFNTSISECQLCIVAYEKKNKKSISFILTEYCNYNKSKMLLSPDQKKKYADRFSDDAIAIKQAYKLGMWSRNRIIDFIHGSIPTHAQTTNTYKRHDELTGEKFDHILNELKTTKCSSEPKLVPCEQYKGWLKNASHWNLLKEYYFVNPKYIPFSFNGNLIKYKNALQYVNAIFKNDWDFLNTISYTWTNKANKDFVATFNRTNKTRKYNKICSYSDITVDKINEVKKRKVYFDFESLNTAIRVIDGTLPYMQTVNQVSVIFDNGDGRFVKKNGLEGSDNIIIDPLIMTVNDYKIIIDSIYPNDNQEKYSYIVYNQNFEVSRLKEMKYLINDEEYSKKVDIIINNIFDLSDLFDFRKPPYICIDELHAFYSIKKVLPMIKKHAPIIFSQTGCKDYNDLEIHNGGQAQTESTKRFFNLLKDDEWKTIANNLKIYCENDVRAMIAVEYFVRSLII